MSVTVNAMWKCSKSDVYDRRGKQVLKRGCFCLQNDNDYEYLNKTVREGRGRFLEMEDLDMFNIVRNS
jgi:hypothetical protein